MKENLEQKLKAFKAITNENRLRILQKVSEKEEGLSFGELRKKLRLNPNTLDYHLQKLADARLIRNVAKVPTLKRTQPNQESGITTLSANMRQEETLGKAHYSYYQITNYGREILTQVGL